MGFNNGDVESKTELIKVQSTL